MLIPCPACQRKLKIPDKAAGKKIACPKCKQTIQVPRETPAAARDQDDEPAMSAAEIAAFFAELKHTPPTDVKKLGAPIAAFKPATGTWRARVIAILLAALACGGGIYLAVEHFRGPPKPDFFCLIGAGFLLLVSAGCIAGATLDFRMGVVVYRGGLLDINGKKMTVVAWDDIAKVWQSITERYANGVSMGTTYKYTIELEDESWIIYTSGRPPRIEVLGQLIQDKVTETLLPGFRAAYKKGESLEFGPLAMDKTGLTCAGYSLRWDEIEALKLEAGHFVICKKGKWLTWGKVAAADVPNVFVFLKLTDRILGTSIQRDSSGPSAADGQR